MARHVRLMRHTANSGDSLTEQGIQDAVDVGASLREPYRLIISSGAQRATQTAACVLAGMGRPVAGGVVVDRGLRSELEERWRAAYEAAGSGDLESLCDADPEFVKAECVLLGAALGKIFELVEDGEWLLAIGHSPANEAAVFGLTGVVIAPLGKGESVVITATDGGYVVDTGD